MAPYLLNAPRTPLTSVSSPACSNGSFSGTQWHASSGPNHRLGWEKPPSRKPDVRARGATNRCVCFLLKPTNLSRSGSTASRARAPPARTRASGYVGADGKVHNLAVDQDLELDQQVASNIFDTPAWPAEGVSADVVWDETAEPRREAGFLNQHWSQRRDQSEDPAGGEGASTSSASGRESEGERASSTGRMQFRNPKDLHRVAMSMSRKGQKRRALHTLDQGMQLFPDNTWFLTAAAVLEGEVGSVERGRQLFARAHELEPGNAVTMQAWAVLEARTGDVEVARKLFQDASQLDPNHAPTWQAWAKMEVGAREPVQAQRLYRQALQADGQHLPTLHAYAECEILLGNEASARKLLTRALSIDPHHERSCMTLSALEFRRGQVSRARKLMRDFAQAATPSALLLCQWAQLEARCHNVAESRQLFRRSLTMDNSNMQTWLGLAALEARSSRPEAAIALYDGALQQEPRNVPVRHAKAQLLRQVGRPEAAMQLLQQLAREQPHNGLVMHTIGIMARSRGDNDVAEAAFTCGCKDRSQRGALLNLEALAELLTFQGRRDDARQVYRQGYAMLRVPQPNTHRFRARFFREWALFEKRHGSWEVGAAQPIHSGGRKRVVDPGRDPGAGGSGGGGGHVGQESEKLFSMAAKLNPADDKTWMHFALFLRRQDRKPEALQCLKRGIVAHRHHYDLWYFWAVITTECCPEAEARQEFQRALKHCPLSMPLYTEYGLWEWKQGNPDRAREIFRDGDAAATRGTGPASVHPPLLEAWSRLELQQGNQEAVEELERRYRLAVEQQAKQPAAQAS